MNYHLIIGYGKWSKKNLKYLKNKNFFDKIIVKRRSKYFFYPKKRQGNKISKETLKDVKSVHICTPFKSHFSQLKKFNLYKKVIIEKPFVGSLDQIAIIKKLYKNKFFLVNYIDTFNPLVSRIKKLLIKKNFNQIVLNYSKKNKFYKGKYDFALEWLDHPLSIILLFFKKFPRFKIIKNQIIKKNNSYNQVIIIDYNFNHFNLLINLNCSSKIERNIQIVENKKVSTFHFYTNTINQNSKKIYKDKKNSFDNFYKTLLKKEKKVTQNFDFHKKIISHRNKILETLKKNNY